MKNKLFNLPADKYGEKYKEHLFEQYKIYADSIERTSERRQSANNYFITINTVLISLIGIFSQLELFDSKLITLLLSLVGIIISVIFWFLIRSYKQLNTGKFKVLHKIEKKLPMSMYEYEWKVLGEGADKKRYFPFSHIELSIPWVFAAIYIAIGIMLFCI